MRRVLFLDGIGSNPDGFKPRFIGECGFHVTTQHLHDLDFIASVTMAEHALGETASMPLPATLGRAEWP